MRFPITGQDDNMGTTLDYDPCPRCQAGQISDAYCYCCHNTGMVFRVTRPNGIACLTCGEFHEFRADRSMCGVGQDNNMASPLMIRMGKTSERKVRFDKANAPGYHLDTIQRGEFGEPSKVLEEAREFMDAIEQGSQVMALLEASDLVGALEGWLAKHHPSLSLDDLGKMSRLTQRAFANGHRSAK